MNLRPLAAWAMVLGGAAFAAAIALWAIDGAPGGLSLRFLLASQFLVLVAYWVPAGARWVRDLRVDPRAPFPSGYSKKRR